MLPYLAPRHVLWVSNEPFRLVKVALELRSSLTSKTRCMSTAAEANGVPDSQPDSGSPAKRGSVRSFMAQHGMQPWRIGFQVRERELAFQYEDAATVEMMKIWMGQKAGRDAAWVDSRLGELSILVPDIVARLPRAKASIILALASDTEGIAAKLIEYQALLPGVNLSAMAACHPALLLEMTPQGVAVQLDRLRAALPQWVNVGRLVEVEPVLLEVDIQGVLSEIRRLLPKEDPVRVLLRDPTIVLNMKAFKMGSSLQDTQ